MIRTSRRGAPGIRWVLASVLALAVLSPGLVTADDSDCATCHENLVKAWGAATHGRLAAFEVLGGQTGCVTCHGDGTAHMDAGGDPEQIVGLGSDRFREDVSDVCLTCHRSESLHDWQGSAHEMNGVGCTDCHNPHAVEAKGDPETCWGCHADVRAQFQYPSHHPLREGHMSCASCHTPHGGSIGLIKHDERPAELCLTCHTQYAGPFIFEHEPVYEGCDGCHLPHGAVANNLLVQNEPFLCLQCHEMHFHAGLEGEEDDAVVIPRYNRQDGRYAPYDDENFEDFPELYPPSDGAVPNPYLGAGYRRAFTTKCTQCHTKVHGTDLPSQSVPSSGRGLMR